MAFWKIFQKAYDNIESWELSPAMKDIVRQLNDALPEVIKKAVLSYFKDNLTRSEGYAKTKLEELRDKLNEII